MAQDIQPSSTAIALARALFELADERKQLETVSNDIAAIGQAVDSTPQLVAFFNSPSIKEADRAAVVERTLIASASPLTAGFLRLLLAKNQLGELPGIARAFKKLVDERSGKVDVDVTVARQLGAQELELVRQRISTAIQKEAVIRQKVDDSILGGIIIRVGDKLIDGSVKAQLQAIETKLLSAV
jgi:F-type H+-transporting ATPase subunit delta